MTTIVPFDKTTVTTITSFSIEVTDVVLFTSVRLRVNLFDANGRRVDCNFLMVEGEDYVAWGNDDQYIVNFVSTKLGFVLPAPVDVPIDVPVDVPVDVPTTETPVDVPTTETPVDVPIDVHTAEETPVDVPTTETPVDVQE